MATHRLDLFIAGAQKAGTTSLLRYLAGHPQIDAHHSIEFSHFAVGEFSRSAVDQAIEKEFSRKAKAIVRVAKHAHLYKEEDFVRNLARHSPDAAIVFIVRNPTDRLVSAYKMAARDGWAEFSLEEILECFDREQCQNEKQRMLNNVFIKLGLYDLAFERLNRHFSRDRIRFFKFDDFVKDPAAACGELFEDLSIDNGYAPDVNTRHNEAVSRTESPIASAVLSFARGRGRFLKESAKLLLPFDMYAGYANRFRSVAVSGAVDARINVSTVEELRKLYRPSVRRFASQSGMRLDDW